MQLLYYKFDIVYAEKNMISFSNTDVFVWLGSKAIEVGPGALVVIVFSMSSVKHIAYYYLLSLKRQYGSNQVVNFLTLSRYTALFKYSDSQKNIVCFKPSSPYDLIY